LEQKSLVDMVHLVRSIQRAEGNPDCYGKARGYCDRTDCAWREYCLAQSQDLDSRQERHQC